MGKKKIKALIIGEIPAPYRVDIFREMSKSMDMHVFFQANKDQSRNPDYFIKNDKLSFMVLDNAESKNAFKKALMNIRQYDLLIAYHPVCKAALQAEWVCKCNGIPYFVNIDGAFVKPNIVKDSIKKWVYQGAIGCFSGGKSATEYFLHYGVNEQKIFEYGFTCLHPEDISATVTSIDEKRNIRKELKIDDLKTIIAVGQFIPRKGFDILLQAWNMIDVTDMQLLIVGGGPDRQQYEEYIRIHELKHVMLIDYMPKELLKKYYRASDVFVLPTREDVWGLVINEAMALGLPVITTDMCNAGKQLIVDGENGYIVPVNATILAEKITELLCHDSLFEIGKRNIEKISNYTIENAVASHLNAIHIAMLSRQNA